MDRHADGATMVRDRAGYGLAYPPACIGGKAIAATVVELANRGHKPQVPFLDKVEEGKLLANKSLSN